MQYIKGMQPFSLIDYPGEIAAVLFLGGCNMRCHYCHNPELVLVPGKIKGVKEEDVLSFLEKRKGKLDAVVITGGEPTLHKEILPLMKKIKALGYLIKLDTNGTNPSLLQACLPYIDYIAMDIKASVNKYENIVNTKVNIDNIKESVEIIKYSGKAYEFRTTVLPKFFNKEEAKNISQWLKGSKAYYIQQIKKNSMVNESMQKERLFSKEELQELQEVCKNSFETVKIRNI